MACLFHINPLIVNISSIFMTSRPDEQVFQDQRHQSVFVCTANIKCVNFFESTIISSAPGNEIIRVKRLGTQSHANSNRWEQSQPGIMVKYHRLLAAERQGFAIIPLNLQVEIRWITFDGPFPSYSFGFMAFAQTSDAIDAKLQFRGMKGELQDYTGR